MTSMRWKYEWTNLKSEWTNSTSTRKSLPLANTLVAMCHGFGKIGDRVMVMQEQECLK